MITTLGLAYGASTESTHLVITNKFGAVKGTLHLPKQPTKIAVIHAHPWGDTSGQWPAPDLAAKGIAVLAIDTRGSNTDALAPDGLNEEVLLDGAAAVQEMKDRGYEKIILYGGSVTYYCKSFLSVRGVRAKFCNRWPSLPRNRASTKNPRPIPRPRT